MFGLAFAFLLTLCFILLPQVQAADVPTITTRDNGNDEIAPNSEENDQANEQDQVENPEDPEQNENNEAEEDSEVPIQCVLIPVTADPWPCQTKYWCEDNDNIGLEIGVEFERTILKVDRLRNMEELKPENRVSRSDLHKWADTLEKQIEQIAETREKKPCWFKCVYCGLEDEDLIKIKDHVVGIIRDKRFWRVSCRIRLDLDEILDPKAVRTTDFPRIFPWASIIYDGKTLYGPDGDFSDEIPKKMKNQWKRHMVDRRKPSCRPLPGVYAEFEPPQKRARACALEPRK